MAATSSNGFSLSCFSASSYSSSRSLKDCSDIRIQGVLPMSKQLRSARMSRPSPLQGFVQDRSSDLLCCIFEFLNLEELAAFWRVSVQLSYSHWRYLFATHHAVNAEAFLSTVDNMDVAYDMYLQCHQPLDGFSFRGCMKHALLGLRLTSLWVDVDTDSVIDLSARLLHWDSIQRLNTWGEPAVVLPVSHLPKYLRDLDTTATVKSSQLRVLPRSLTELEMSHITLDCHIRSSDWPPNLTSLNLRSWTLENQAVSGDVTEFKVELPDFCSHPQLTELFLPANDVPFTVPQYLPPSLRRLLFKARYVHRQKLSKDIAELTALESLDLGASYPFELQPAMFPQSLTKLDLPATYNLPLAPGVLPIKLTVLHLGADYNHPLSAGILPQGLQELILSADYNCELLSGCLPASLRKLDLGSSYNFPLKFGVLPPKLEILYWARSTELALSEHCFPPSLTILYASPLQETIGENDLPENLQELEFGPGENESDFMYLSEALPASLRRLNAPDYCFGICASGTLPKSLTELIVGQGYCAAFEQNFPAGLRILDLSSALHYNQLFSPGMLPTNLERLLLGCAYNQPLTEQNLPTGLLELNLQSADEFQQQISFLPDALRILSLSAQYGVCFEDHVLHQPLSELMCPAAALSSLRHFPCSLQRVSLTAQMPRDRPIMDSVQLAIAKSLPHCHISKN